MNKDEKQTYLDKYKDAKKKGVPFFPDIVFKDAVISLLVFVILVALAYFVGAPLEARANPGDTIYTPRPEWYFLFLFQLLKYFPGKLEVIGVFVIPTIVILALICLPFIDRSAKRHPIDRPIITIVTILMAGGIVTLTILAAREAPPPTTISTGDQTAALYIKNCAPCHKASIVVPQGTNLVQVISQGKHQGMPAWSADLTSSEIDALAGFILSPTGANLFDQFCSGCHKATDLVIDQPLDLEKSIDEGLAYAPHAGKNVPDFSKVITSQERSLLLDFLVAPDGQRLFATNCALCHGSSISYTGSAAQLLDTIKKGGLHLEMPAWQERLSGSELDALAQYVVSPTVGSPGEALFGQYCITCHGSLIPQETDLAKARQAIASGGAHSTMPAWGNILTSEQLDALVKYIIAATSGTPEDLGQQLYTQNCAGCHGIFGEGGPSPLNPRAMILPISSSDFLKTRDDATLHSIIAQGQPNSGMSPFGSAYGGPLEDDQIDAIVAYIRAWEAKPPVEQPLQAPTPEIIDLSASDIYGKLCSQCHGLKGEGGSLGPSLSSQDFESTTPDEEIYNTISQGSPGTTMFAWGDVLSTKQIQDLVQYLRELGKLAPPAPTSTPTPAVTQEITPTEIATVLPTFTSTPTSAVKTVPTFDQDVLPIFKSKCSVCHGTLGGWNGDNYQDAISSGDHGPDVIPGNITDSILAQKIQNKQTFGVSMPIGTPLSTEEIQIILDWIAGGAPEK